MRRIEAGWGPAPAVPEPVVPPTNPSEEQINQLRASMDHCRDIYRENHANFRDLDSELIRRFHNQYKVNGFNANKTQWAILMDWCHRNQKMFAYVIRCVE